MVYYTIASFREAGDKYGETICKHKCNVYTIVPTTIKSAQQQICKHVYHFKTDDEFPCDDDDDNSGEDDDDDDDSNEESRTHDIKINNMNNLRSEHKLFWQPAFKCKFGVCKQVVSKSLKYRSDGDYVELVNQDEINDICVSSSCNPFKIPIISLENRKKYHVYFRNVIYTCCGRKCVTCSGK